MKIRIKNRAELLKNLPAEIKKKRVQVFEIIEDVLNKIQPANLFKNEFDNKDLSGFKRVVIFAIGKAAGPMAKAVVKSLKRKPDIVLLADIGHPWPTVAGVCKTKKMIAVAKSLTEKDLAIVLISGGGSAMFVCPADGVTLKEKIALTKSLLKSGAPIAKINAARKKLSAVKGGRFAQFLYPATVWGYAISDVIGNDPSTIASGPISPDKSNHINSKYFKKIKFKIVADHYTALKFAQDKAKEMGLKVVVVEDLLKGEAKKTALRFAKNCPKKKIKLGCGETTVTINGNGFGGRNQEFVLSGLPYLKSDQVLVSIGTDGVDGVAPEKVAGAIVDYSTLKKAQKHGLDPAAFLNNNDSYSFFKKTKSLIKTGSTGTNLGDLVILL